MFCAGKYGKGVEGSPTYAHIARYVILVSYSFVSVVCVYRAEPRVLQRDFVRSYRPLVLAAEAEKPAAPAKKGKKRPRTSVEDTSGSAFSSEDSSALSSSLSPESPFLFTEPSGFVPGATEFDWKGNPFTVPERPSRLPFWRFAEWHISVLSTKYGEDMSTNIWEQ